MITYPTLWALFLTIAFGAGFIVYLLQCLYVQAKRHQMAIDALDEARELQVHAVSLEVEKRDARIATLNTTSRILKNDRDLLRGAVDREESRRRTAWQLLAERTAEMQRLEVEVRTMKERSETVTARIKAVKAAAGDLSAKAHAVTSQMLRPGVQEIPTSAVQDIATAAKNTRQAARNLEVFAS